MIINRIQESCTHLLQINRLEFQDTELWFTDQNSQPLEIENRIKLTLVIKWNIYWCIKMRYSKVY